MPSETLTYIGAATGIIGALSGVGGVIVSVISYRRVKAIKALDLRVRLRQERNETEEALKRLEEILRQAKRSRRSVSTTAGQYGGSAMATWEEQWEEDNNQVRLLKEQLPSSQSEYYGLNAEQLEEKIDDLHRKKLRAITLTRKYKDDIASDTVEQERILNHRL